MFIKKKFSIIFHTRLRIIIYHGIILYTYYKMFESRTCHITSDAVKTTCYKIVNVLFLLNVQRAENTKCSR